MSLVPFVIRWMDDTHFAPSPTAAYGVVLVLCSIAYILLERAIIKCNGPTSKLARAVGKDLKGKMSLLVYALAISLAFVRPWIALALYVAIAMIWFIADRRIESIAQVLRIRNQKAHANSAFLLLARGWNCGTLRR